MKARLAAIAVGLLAIPSPAQACLEDPYPHALIYENRPEAQPDAFPVKVQVTSAPTSARLMVRVLEGPGDLVGRTFALQAEHYTSCQTDGRRKGYAQVRRVRSGGRTVRLMAIAFDRSWWDSISYLVGAGIYRYPGDRVEVRPFP